MIGKHIKFLFLFYSYSLFVISQHPVCVSSTGSVLAVNKACNKYIERDQKHLTKSTIYKNPPTPPPYTQHWKHCDEYTWWIHCDEYNMMNAMRLIQCKYINFSLLAGGIHAMWLTVTAQDRIMLTVSAAVPGYSCRW